ncbi:unnamed protein product [Schistosoma rodhaini]|uniref:Serpin domain-containing protein n=1 Tax=Schistosoma rodhaini TaxID=6188 RepID=A0AA85GFR9_9TREM|nr:unnamed protein product [Schistosoma rodhaini]
MDVIQSLGNFSERFYREILKRNEGYLENTFLSPFNIYTALGMILSGSANNTKAELIAAMQLPDCLEQEKIHSAIGELLADFSKLDEGVQIIIRNGIYVNDGVKIKKQFKNIIKQYYNALTEHVAFRTDSECARNQINQWVSEQTNGAIQELMPPESLSYETSAVILSTTYFKGLWDLPFPNENSHDSDFFKLDGSTMNVELMYNVSYFNMVILPHLKSRAIKLPFIDPKYMLLVILPNSNDGLPDLLNLMCNDGGISAILSRSFENTLLNLYLPKFKLKQGYSLSLKTHLKELEINDAFNPQSADFSNISISDKLCLTDVFHKSILEIDEEGVVAAGVTACMFDNCDSESSEAEVEFCVDHSFFVSIIWNNILPIFLGHVTTPVND